MGYVNPVQKLTRRDVLVIRDRRAEGALYSDLAREFGVSDTAVRSAATGVSHRDVGGPLAEREGQRTKPSSWMAQCARRGIPWEIAKRGEPCSSR